MGEGAQRGADARFVQILPITAFSSAMQSLSGAVCRTVGPAVPSAQVSTVATQPTAVPPSFNGIAKYRGGAEIPVSLLFADVRGSTALAERMSARDFRTILDRFYKVVYRAVDQNNGVIDHLAGDGVMALWTPRFGGEAHARHALAAGRQLVSELRSDRVLRGRIPAGVGVHTGTAWVGVVGETGAHDFTVLGDAPNTVARLGSSAAGGELMLSNAIATETSTDTSQMERRLLDLKGKSEPFEALVETG